MIAKIRIDVTGKTILDVANRITTMPFTDVCEASAFIEMQENILAFPRFDYSAYDYDDRWTLYFKSTNQLLLFRLRYGEVLEEIAQDDYYKHL